MDNSDSQGAKIFKLPVPFRDPLRRNLFLLVQGTLERALLLNQLNRIYLQISEKANHKYFFEQALERLGIRYEATEPDLASIPRDGPLVVVANHPFGGVEGLILGSLLLAIRSDVKIMANYVLGRIPEIRDMLLCVDPFETKESPIRNLKPLRDAIAWLKAGHVLAVFPAGGVSHLNLQERQVSDPRWSDSIARIVRRSGAPVLPVFFEGTNSALFQLAGLVHSKLRTALLPHELLNKSNKSVTVRIGSIIPVKRLDTFPDHERVITYLRMRTYALKHRCPKAAGRGPIMLFRRTSRITPQIIVSGPNENVLAQEVDRLPADQLLLRNGDYAVFHAKAHQLPNLLFEIGRLRELTFRQVGEGTGKSIDLDRFDLYYTHLFVWDLEKKRVVGAYRLGQVDRILGRYGKKGLYTSTLFDYKNGFLQHVDRGIELGRSFVSPEYQKLYSPLLLLWKGIAHYVARNPHYTILFGPVTISGAYAALSRQLMVSYLTVNHFAPDLARFIRPRTPLRGQTLKLVGLESAATLPPDIDELSSLISDIEVDRKGVPVLLKQYVRLGGKLMGFNVDPSFGSGLDGLILVNLLECDRRILDRYMGKSGSEVFLNYHDDPSRRGLAS